MDVKMPGENIDNAFTIFAESKIDTDNFDEITAALLLQNSIREAKKRNYKKAMTECHQAFIESNKDENSFLSKLLELKLRDLETLFICLFGCDKNRRLSKQHDKKITTKKKTNTNTFTFSNSAYELDSLSSTSIHSRIDGRENNNEEDKHHSLRNFKDRPSIIEENNQMKDCLRKALYLMRDLSSSKTIQNAFETILAIHFKVKNYDPCVALFVQFKDKKFINKLIFELNDVQRHNLCEICLHVATNFINQKEPNLKHHIQTSIDYCKMACKFSPHERKPNEILCYLYRQNNESENAFSVAKHYLDEIEANSKSMLMQLLLCEIDYGKIEEVLSQLVKLLNEKAEGFTEFHFLRVMTLVYSSKVSESIECLERLDVTRYNDLIKSICDQVKSEFLETVVREFSIYIHEQKNKFIDEFDKKINSIKMFFLMTSQCLAVKNLHQIKFAKIYSDNLILCREYEIASTYLTELIKYYANESLPVVLLATLRLTIGAYAAATEDFRMVLNMYGSEKLASDFQNLSEVEKEEIARVHRVSGFRFLSKDGAYSDAIECFSIALCAIGLKAVGLALSRGICYMHLNNFECASKDFDTCLAQDPKSPSALFARAVVYTVTTHVEEAIRCFKSAFELDSNECKTCLTKLPLEHALTFAQLVIQYIKQELERVQVIDKSLYYDSNKNDQIKKRTVDGFDISVTKYSLMLCEAFPNNIDYLCTHIECLYAAKDINYALGQISIYLQAHKDRYLFVWKAVLLSSQKRFDEALSELFQIAEIDDQVGNILFHLGPKERKFLLDFVYQKAQYLDGVLKYNDSLIFHDIAVLLSNNDTKAFKSRMNCYKKLGNSQKWLKDLTKVIELEPQATQLLLRAEHYKSEGQDILSCEDFISALDLNEEETIINVTIKSNGEDVVNLFHNVAAKMFEYQKPKEVLRLCDAGLRFDPKHKGLKHLREKTHSELQRCVIQ